MLSSSQKDPKPDDSDKSASDKILDKYFDNKADHEHEEGF